MLSSYQVLNEIEAYLQEDTQVSVLVDTAGLIRFYLDDREYCPLTYLALKQGEGYYFPSEYPAACRRMHVHPRAAAAVVAAADNMATGLVLREQLRRIILSQGNPPCGKSVSTGSIPSTSRMSKTARCSSLPIRVRRRCPSWRSTLTTTPNVSPCAGRNGSSSSPP